MKDTKSSKINKTKKVSVSKENVKVLSKEDTKELPKVEEVSKKKAKHSRIRLYFSYEKRLFINVVLLAVFLALSLYCARKTLTKEDIDPISYTETESIDYKVYLKENDFFAGVISSQVISNVPAALLLYPFSSDTRNLLLGVNAGGLGTLIASLASLISFKLYSVPAKKFGLPSSSRYLAVFTAVNLAFLAVLCALRFLLP